jgi:hypothetical protein
MEKVHLKPPLSPFPWIQSFLDAKAKSNSNRSAVAPHSKYGYNACFDVFTRAQTFCFTENAKIWRDEGALFWALDLPHTSAAQTTIDTDCYATKINNNELVFYYSRPKQIVPYQYNKLA